MSEEFDQMEIQMSAEINSSKPIYIKLSAGTDMHQRVMMVAGHLGVTPTKAGRMLMRTGWLGFVRSVSRGLKAVKK